VKILVLVGSGEFTQSMIKIDGYLIERVEKIKRKQRINVAIIPTASVPDERQQNWIDEGVKHFKRLGVNPFGLNIVEKHDASKKSNLDKLKTASVIYFSGGHPGYLLKIFKNSKSWNLIENLYEGGKILIGSSAGAMILGNYVLANAQEAFDKGEKPMWKKGLDLVPYSIFPHFDWAQKYKQKLLKKVIDSAPKAVRECWMGIDEDTALLVFNNKQVRLMGKGTLTIQLRNKSRTYRVDQEFII